MSEEVPDGAVGVYFEIWTHCKYPESNNVDKDGYRKTFINSTVFMGRDVEPEEFTEEKIENRRDGEKKVKNHTWLFPEENFNEKTTQGESKDE